MHDFAKRRGARMIWVKKRVVDGAFAEANLQQARELLALVEQEAAQRAVPREASPAFLALRVRHRATSTTDGMFEIG